MKRILFFILLVISFAADAQVKQQMGTYGIRSRRIQPDSAFRIPTVQVGIKDAYAGFDTAQIYYRKSDSSLLTYTGSQWILARGAAGAGSSYTAGDGLLLTGSEFKVLTKRSITIDNDSLMLVNDSTASPVSYFYGTNVAGRKGWYAQSGLRPYTFTNGLTESGGTVKLGGTLADATTTISGDGKDLTITNLAALNIDGTESFNIQVSSGGSSGVLTVDGGNSQFVSTRTGATSTFKVDEDSIISKPHIGAYYIDTLLYTLSTTGKKIMLRDTATGLVQNIDPALITGATPTLQQVLTAGSTLTTANTIDLAGNELEITDNGYDIFMLAPADSNDPTWLESTFTMAGRAQMGTFKTQSGPTSSFTQMTSHYDILDSNIHSQIDLRSNKDSSRILYEADDGYHRFSGNVGIGTVPTSLLHVAGVTQMGTAGATLGQLKISGNTSGTITIQPAAAAGTYTLTLPTNDGDASQFLQTNGSGVLSFATVSGTLPSIGNQGEILQVSNGAAAWKYDTTTLVTFNWGGGFQSDTAAFVDSVMYGSFKLMGNDTFYVTGVSVVLYSNNAITDTLGIQITYNDTINVIGSHVFAATYGVNNETTGQDADGDDFTGSNSVPIPPGNWVWLKSPTVVAGRKPYHLSVSIIGYKKRVN